MSNTYAVCSHESEGTCCFRYKGTMDFNMCYILCDANFIDGKCHFRKKDKYGPNEYDLLRKKGEL